MRAEKRQKTGNSPDAAVPSPVSGPSVTVAVATGATLEPALSPARVLQEQLGAQLTGEYVADAQGEARWSTRRTLVFLIVTNGLFWLAAAWGTTVLLASL